MSQKFQQKLRKQHKKKKQMQRLRAKAAAQRESATGFTQEEILDYRRRMEHLNYMREALADPDKARAMGFTWFDDIGPHAMDGFAEVVREMDAFQATVTRAIESEGQNRG